jgi:hypothetical protein
MGHAVAYLVEALCLGQRVSGSCPDEVDFYNLPNSSSCTMALGSTQPLTEMSTRNLPGGVGGQRVSLTTLPPSLSRLSRENVGASTSHNPMGLHGLLQRQLLHTINMASLRRSKAHLFSYHSLLNKNISIVFRLSPPKTWRLQSHSQASVSLSNFKCFPLNFPLIFLQQVTSPL